MIHPLHHPAQRAAHPLCAGGGCRFLARFPSDLLWQHVPDMPHPPLRRGQAQIPSFIDRHVQSPHLPHWFVGGDGNHLLENRFTGNELEVACADEELEIGDWGLVDRLIS